MDGGQSFAYAAIRNVLWATGYHSGEPHSRRRAPHRILHQFGVVIVNFLTRQLAHRSHVKQYKNDGAEAVAIPAHTLTTRWSSSRCSFMILEPHGGMVLSVLVLGVFFADFFEFESRCVEARSKNLELERPKSAIVGSVLVLMYAAYQSLFCLISGPWSAIV